ncbi:MAG: hypothetical protein IJ316_03200 [Clostridia bacterium]|nr:hypothetical protein [Clostridia bacterium]
MQAEIIDGIVCVKRKINKNEIPFYDRLAKLRCTCFQLIVRIDGDDVYEEAMNYEPFYNTSCAIDELYKIFLCIKENKLPCTIAGLYICDGVLKAYVIPTDKPYREKDLCDEYAALLGLSKKFFYLDCVRNFATKKGILKYVPGFRSGNSFHSMLAIFIYMDCFLWALAVALVFGHNPDETYFWAFWYILTFLVMIFSLDFFYLAERLLPLPIPRWIKIFSVSAFVIITFAVTYITIGFVVIEGGL